MCMRNISLGYSPCPNDTFIFYALVHGKIDTEDFVFKETLLDVETLNRMALSSELDITKVSYHAFGFLRKDYCLLRSGSAMGRGCGPLIVSKDKNTVKSLQGKKIAIPGKLPTANLLLQLFAFDSGIQFSSHAEMDFHRIMDSVSRGDVDAGLIIHEGRFTYHLHGLKQVIDQHINSYVNDYSLDIGEEGLSAVRDLFRKAAMKGMLKEPVDDLLCIT